MFRSDRGRQVSPQIVLVIVARAGTEDGLSFNVLRTGIVTLWVRVLTEEGTAAEQWSVALSSARMTGPLAPPLDKASDAIQAPTGRQHCA